ncbi:MAG: YceI family protein [Propionibacteriaceae bacterium]|nr:YceI family protein [Micropruina sp.]HBY21922.1 polyisoprenoid-binding protein [Propionibacteriaceae bacterium]
MSVKDLSGTYVLDPSHSTIGFSARHAMVTKVRGAFTNVAGTAVVDGGNPAASTIEVTIQADSFDTGQADRDGHVKSADFLDVANFPTLTFKATDIAITDDETVRVTGDLTIKGVSHSVTIDLEYNGSAKDPFGNERVGFEGEADIKRSDWGLTWNAALETGGFLVSDKIELKLDISAIKQA